LQFAATTARQHQLELKTNSVAEKAINSAGTRGDRKVQHGKVTFEKAVNSTKIAGHFRNNVKNKQAWSDREE
jgi:hypothetical protein